MSSAIDYSLTVHLKELAIKLPSKFRARQVREMYGARAGKSFYLRNDVTPCNRPYNQRSRACLCMHVYTRLIRYRVRNVYQSIYRAVQLCTTMITLVRNFTPFLNLKALWARFAMDSPKVKHTLASSSSLCQTLNRAKLSFVKVWRLRLIKAYGFPIGFGSGDFPGHSKTSGSFSSRIMRILR